MKIYYYDKYYNKFIDDDLKDYELILGLKYPPSVNNHWQPVKDNYSNKATVRVSQESLDYHFYVKMLVFELYEKLNLDANYIMFGKHKRLQISILVFPPDKRKRDIDNILKVLFDSLEKSNIIYNDSQFEVLYIRRYNCQKQKDNIKSGVIVGIKEIV